MLWTKQDKESMKRVCDSLQIKGLYSKIDKMSKKQINIIRSIANKLLK